MTDQDELKIVISAKKILEHQLILRESLASGTRHGKQYSISLAPNGFIILETPDNKYSLSLTELLSKAIDAEQSANRENNG